MCEIKKKVWRYSSYCILHLRIGNLSDLKSTLPGSTAREKRARREGRAWRVLSSHHCSVTLIVTVELLGPNKLV